MSMIYERMFLQKAKTAWKRAAAFPIDKEQSYPDHVTAQEFDHHHGLRVLEYGCGGGSDARSYIARDNYVIACDIVPENVNTTRQNTFRWVSEGRLGTQLAEVLGCQVLESSSPLPFPDGEFDLVNSHGVVHHIPNPVPVVEEFYRVLRPGGLVYIMLYTEILWMKGQEMMRKWLQSGECATQEEAFCWFTDLPGVPYARKYTEAEGKALLEDAGFIVTSTYMYNNGDFRTFRGMRPAR